MTMWRMTAIELRDAVHAGSISALEVVDSCLERITELNPAINAVTVALPQEARETARTIDRKRARRESLGALAGVPFTVKEDLHVAGTPTTFGVPRLRHLVAPADAPPVRRLRAADAIPIAHTNLSDLSIGGTNTRSQLYGTTFNPWDLGKSPGGSGGGDAAAVAAGLVPLGLGNDSGGSIRLPAMFCGITGLKPGYGRFPADHRIGPAEPSLASQLFPVDGPLARTVADLSVAYEILAGDDPADPRTAPIPLAGRPLNEPVRVGVTVDPGGGGVASGVSDAIARAADALREAGYVLEEIEVPRLSDALDGYHTLINTEFGLAWPSIRPLLTDESAAHLELSMRHHPPADLEHYIAATGLRHGVIRDWRQFQERYPLLLGPVNTRPAGPADASDTTTAPLENPLRLCTASTFVGVPAVAVPTGLWEGMPTGVQLIGPHHREDICLVAAQAIETRLGTLTPIDAFARLPCSRRKDRPPKRSR
jgi:amidase